MVRVRTWFDHFELVEYIDAGGMGKVYKARDLKLNRIVALKLLHKEFSADAEHIEKLTTEAKITASVTHPNIVKVFSFGCDHGVYYIAMELVDKGSLDDLMTSRGRIPESRVLEIGIHIAQGLRAAYRAGLIHRDVKPGNILFADHHTAKIVDFGLAMPLDQAQEGEEDIWGTPYYVSPEKLDKKPEDFRSDIYSLGGTLFHALAARPPFEARNASVEDLKRLKSQPVNLLDHLPSVSSPTAYLINRTLARDPRERYQSYDELIEHLEYARTQLLACTRKLRRPKAQASAHENTRQSSLGCVLLVLFALAILMVLTVVCFPPPSSSPRTAAVELARQQMAHSQKTLEKVLSFARAQLLSGDTPGALKALQPLQSQRSFPKPFQPVGVLIAALNEWEAARFEAADPLFQKFLDTKPDGVWEGIGDIKPLAQGFRDDYAAFADLVVQRKAADTPLKIAVAARKIPRVKAKLKMPGPLPEALEKMAREVQP